MSSEAELTLRICAQAEEITELRERLLERRIEALTLRAGLSDALGAMDAYALAAGISVVSQRIDEIRGMVRDG